MVGAIIPSIYYFFTYFHILPYLFIHLFFLMTNTIYAVREHFAVLIFSKYLVLEL